MSDPTNAALESEAESVQPPPSPVAEPETESQGPSDLDEAKDMIKTARDEAAARRVEHKPYKEAFRGFNEDEQGYLLDIVRRAGGSASEQKGAADDFRRLAEILSGEDPSPKTVEEAVIVETEDKGDEFTAESVRKMMDEMLNEDRLKRDQQTNLNSRVSEIKAEAAELGFEEGTPQYGYLMTIARTQTNGDLAEAARVFNDMITEKVTEAGGSLDLPSDTKWPTAPSTVGTPPPGNGQPDWVGDTDKTTKAVRQWLNSRA